MKIENYFKSLRTIFSKSDVIDDCQATRDELTNTSIPAYVSANTLMKGWKFKSEKMRDRIPVFNKLVKNGGPGNIITVIMNGLPTALENLNIAEDLVKRTYNTNVGAAGMTYLKAQVLQYTEAVAFVSRYSRRFLNYIYSCELAEDGGDGMRLQDAMVPAELKYIEDFFLSFCTAFNTVCDTPANLRKHLDNIPDITINKDNLTTVGATVGDTKLDPFGFNLIPISMNPIYHVGMYIAEYQAARYKAAKEELQLLQLKRLQLEKQLAGKEDASLQRQIVYMTGRIQGLNAEIAKAEKS